MLFMPRYMHTRQQGDDIIVYDVITYALALRWYKRLNEIKSEAYDFRPDTNGVTPPPYFMKTQLVFPEFLYLYVVITSSGNNRSNIAVKDHYCNNAIQDYCDNCSDATTPA
jgi:hypothetical protein